MIEVNPSINRAGVQVQRLVGEATQSQRVALPPLLAAEAGAADNGSTVDATAAAVSTGVPQAKPARDPPASSFFRPKKVAAPAGKQPGGISSQRSKGGGRENGSKADTDPKLPHAQAADTCATPANGLVQAQGGNQPPPLTLLLFEEVDNLQEEDRGFISTLQELLACSKVGSSNSAPEGLVFIKQGCGSCR